MRCAPSLPRFLQCHRACFCDLKSMKETNSTGSFTSHPFITEQKQRSDNWNQENQLLLALWNLCCGLVCGHSSFTFSHVLRPLLLQKRFFFTHLPSSFLTLFAFPHVHAHARASTLHATHTHTPIPISLLSSPHAYADRRLWPVRNSRSWPWSRLFSY